MKIILYIGRTVHNIHLTEVKIVRMFLQDFQTEIITFYTHHKYTAS